MSGIFAPEAVGSWFAPEEKPAGWFDPGISIPSGGTPAFDGGIMVWTGSAWVEKPVKFWSGSAWVQKPLKFWDGTQWRIIGGAPPPSPAEWFTPASAFQITPNSAPNQYYQATLAWSHRFTAGQLDYPRVTNRMLLSEGGFLDVQGEDDSGGLNILGSLVSWAYDTLGMTFTSSIVTPGVTHNYVMLWDVAGGLSSGHRAQLWQDGTLVGYASGTISDVALFNMRLLGDATNELAGETQGYWWKDDTAMDPATMFAELFDGTNGMLDLSAAPAIDGVTPDGYQFGPP